HMEMKNYSAVTQFFLVGLSKYPELQLSLFMFCFIMYMIILLGNSLLIIISILDSCLHTPMYFFLGNLSFLDICYTSSSIPPMLIIFRSGRKSISFVGCALQMVVSLGLGSIECVLLAVMAYDHYVAICNPLRYCIIMTLFMYMKPKSKGTNTSDEIIGLSYGVATLMLNPITYSLRNKEVKEAMNKILARQLHSWKI
uniref:G-protein coupled receptors family 1 profile domain-containing protein n=1 Tax=Sus scrofa TaxID=9823 RepID=A0A8D1IRJ8_PIG